jgi:hypothetical protein
MHEKVFFVHDLVHHAIPDLVYNGTFVLKGSSIVKGPLISEKVERFTYIAYRLMSEAITLVAADMCFVDHLFKMDGAYQTADARKIFPLFRSLSKNLPKNATDRMLTLMRANMKFCLLGDATYFQENSSNKEKVADYVEKYEKFFLQDFRWTEHNYDDMRKHPDAFHSWWKEVSTWTDQKLLTVQEFIGLLPSNYMECVNQIDSNCDTPNCDTSFCEQACIMIFEKILELYIVPAFTLMNDLLPFSVRYDRMFRKYMMAQCNIFFKFKDVLGEKEIANYVGPISQRMRDKEIITPQQGQSLRFFYLDFLMHLKSLSLLTEDDVETFKEVYPLFEPMILSYDNDEQFNDKKSTTTSKHRAFVYRILNM